MKAAVLTQLATEWLERTYPGYQVFHELSIGSYGSARLDVAVITPKGIVGVEVKGDGDTCARLAYQGAVYSRVARYMWVLPCEALRPAVFKQTPPKWGRLASINGRVQPMPHKWGNSASASKPSDTLAAEPMLDLLWSGEARDLLKEEGLMPPKRASGSVAKRILYEALPTPKIHDLMIRALLRRKWYDGKATVLDAE